MATMQNGLFGRHSRPR